KQLGLAEPVEVWVELTNTSSRRIHGQIRDGWQPQANDPQPIHRMDIVPGATQRFTSVLTPSRRGTVRSHKLTVRDRKSTRLNSSHVSISYAVFCLKKKKEPPTPSVTDSHP